MRVIMTLYSWVYNIYCYNVYDNGSTKEGVGNAVILKQSFYILLELHSIKLDYSKIHNVIHIATIKKI